MIKLLSYIPFSILYLISDFLSFTTYHVVRYRKKTILHNLRTCFPEKSDDEIRSLAREFYTNLADGIVELVKSFSLNKKDFRVRVKYNNIEVLQDQFDQGRSVFCMACHLCNWEWMLPGFHSFFSNPIDAIYLPLSGRWSERLMYKVRSRFGGYPIPMDRAAREIIKRSKEGARAFALVADQMPSISQEKYWTTFLGVETSFFVGGDVLARMTKSAVVFFGMRRVKRGYYEVDLILLGAPPFKEDKNYLIESYVRYLDSYIREYPGTWLWTHKRWQYSKEDCERSVQGKS